MLSYMKMILHLFYEVNKNELSKQENLSNRTLEIVTENILQKILIFLKIILFLFPIWDLLHS